MRMLSFRNNLRKWTSLLLGDNNYSRGRGGEERGGGRISSSRELLTPDLEFTRERQTSFPSAWKPVWYTGWHSGVLACATSVMVVLLINVSFTLYIAKGQKHKIERGIGTVYSGSCEKAETIGMWLHLGINSLSTLLLSGSNYTQQCLTAPTRTEIDAAHARRRWMDIGVPSVRNLFRIKLERTLLWIAIGLTSIPLHLLYNSVVYTSLEVNEFYVAVVTNDYFEPAAYWNVSKVFPNSFPGPYHEYDAQRFKNVLEKFNTSSFSYQDVTALECARLYNTDLMSSHRNLLLIAKRSSNATHNNTVLDTIYVPGDGTSPSSWMYAYNKAPMAQIYRQNSSICNPSDLVSGLERGLPWRVTLKTGEEVEISRCKSELRARQCNVQFSLGIMIVVICCNLVKACCMVMTVVRSREPTLVTLGDAIDSFLRIPDPTTMGICFADREFIKREWGRGGRIGSRQWKQRGVQRWWASASKVRWITCNLFCFITIITAAVLLRLGMNYDEESGITGMKSMWDRGFKKAEGPSQLTIPFGSVTQAVLLVNLPQTILSFLYLTYNSLFTCMLMGHEWALFSNHHRTIRVTSPRPGQRSTYWLQIPYTYAIPLMTFSGLLHWLTSQSIFLAKVGELAQGGVDISTVGYSCMALSLVLTLGILALLTAAGMGYKQFAAETTTVGSCSAAISAACHASEEDLDSIVGKKVRWGDVGIIPYLGIRHLTFSSEEGVRSPVFGEVYLGTGKEGE